MLNNIELNSYIDNDSVINKINPLFKIISIIFILFLSVLSNNIESHLLIILLIINIIILSKIDILHYLKVINNIKYFLLIIFIFNMFFINITDNIINILRIIELIIYSKLITFTTKTSDINYAITLLFTPLKIFKINPLFISMSITLTIKFIPIVINQINTIIKSLKVKGIYFSDNIKKNIIILKQIIKPIFKNSISTSDKIANMIELKHFDFNKKRSNYFSHKVAIRDIIFSLIFILITIVIVRGEL